MPGFCRSDAVGATATATYAPQGVVFNNAAWARQTTQLTGVADSGLVTVALAIKLIGAAQDGHVLTAGSTNGRFTVGRNISHAIYIFARNAGNTEILRVTTSPLAVNVWHSVLFSINLSSASLRHFYVNDVSDFAVDTTSAEGQAINFTVDNLALGNSATVDTAPLNAEVADLWVDYGRYVDFSITANRRLFFAAGTNCLVDKGANGQLPFGVAPRLFFKGPAAGFITNLGTGGIGMSQITGTLTDSSVDPCGA